MDNDGRHGPCAWPDGACPDDLYGLANEQAAAEVEAEAAFVLWSFTGQRFGVCDVEIAPPPACHCVPAWCSCRGCVIYLPGPVHAVTSVEVDGEPYDGWVLRGDQLVSSKPWPRDVVVDYRRGIPPPAGASRVVSELARELALARCNPGKCRIPPNLFERTRQGDTIRLRPERADRIGIPMIDLWITAANQARAPGSVWTPDVEPQLFGPVASSGGSP